MSWFIAWIEAQTGVHQLKNELAREQRETDEAVKEAATQIGIAKRTQGAAQQIILRQEGASDAD